MILLGLGLGVHCDDGLRYCGVYYMLGESLDMQELRLCHIHGLYLARC